MAGSFLNSTLPLSLSNHDAIKASGAVKVWFHAFLKLALDVGA
jgi:hypothetical protein